MDKSEQYIKMCEKAEEIQELRGVANWADGDFYGSVFRDGVFVAYKGNDAWADIPAYQKHRIECIWLPRQDQLQEMMPRTLGTIYAFTLEDLFHRYIHRVAYDEMGIAKIGFMSASMEQLWLAFVMKEKYNKVWAGDSWEATTN